MRNEINIKWIKDLVEKEKVSQDINSLSIAQLEEMCMVNKMKIIPLIKRRVVEYGIAREFKLIER